MSVFDIFKRLESENPEPAGAVKLYLNCEVHFNEKSVGRNFAFGL